MSKREKRRKGFDKGLPDKASYAVGYARPPTETRFTKGKSGNPKGRPRGSKNKRPKLSEERLKDIILEEAYRTINVRDGAREVSIPIAQAVVRSLAVNAAKGQHRAQRLFSELLADVEAANRRTHDEWVQTAIAYKVEWERELECRARFGVTGPEPLPHPDDIRIDMNTGEVRITGPMQEHEKPLWDKLRSGKAMFETELAELRQELEDDPHHEHRTLIENDIAHAERMLAIFQKALPD